MPSVTEICLTSLPRFLQTFLLTLIRNRDSFRNYPNSRKKIFLLLALTRKKRGPEIHKQWQQTMYTQKHILLILHKKMFEHANFSSSNVFVYTYNTRSRKFATSSMSGSRDMTRTLFWTMAKNNGKKVTLLRADFFVWTEKESKNPVPEIALS